MEMPFREEVYALSPKSETIMGLPCYPTLRDIPGPVDHVTRRLDEELSRLTDVFGDLRGSPPR